MSLNIRQHLQADLEVKQTTITALVDKVSPGSRRDQTVPALVWRCTKFEEEETVAGKSSECLAWFEIAIWAGTLEECLAIRDALVTIYHGTGGYLFGGNDDEDPIEIDSSRKIAEHDGDRESDTYVDVAGSVALSLVFEFQWLN